MSRFSSELKDLMRSAEGIDGWLKSRRAELAGVAPESRVTINAAELQGLLDIAIGFLQIGQGLTAEKERTNGQAPPPAS